ncbi:MAG: helix-turn-helix transcriptional regulator [Alphaproteobacteria bacterium]|nr:helix-turn-helix transcriptional regulator [Alphaproteobacteria bacterium]
MRIETKTELEMLQKRQRLTNLKNLRLDIARILQNLLTENKLTITELAHMTSWSPIYLQALINGQATPNIGELNYLMSLFHKKIQLTLTD